MQYYTRLQTYQPSQSHACSDTQSQNVCATAVATHQNSIQAQHLASTYLARAENTAGAVRAHNAPSIACTVLPPRAHPSDPHRCPTYSPRTSTKLSPSRHPHRHQEAVSYTHLRA